MMLCACTQRILSKSRAFSPCSVNQDTAKACYLRASPLITNANHYRDLSAFLSNFRLVSKID